MSNFDFWTSPRDSNQLELRANAWREALDCADELAPNLLSILEKRLPKINPTFSLRVVDEPLPNHVPALTTFDPPEIWVTEQTYQEALKNCGRHRFTLAHELGHVLIHSGNPIGRAPSSHSSAIPRIRSSEWQANKFAASFLMPAHIMKSFDVPLSASRAFDVSVEAAEIRMRELDLWPRSKRAPDLSFLDKYRT